MATDNQPRRRFAPVPIETTFQSNRRNSKSRNQPHVGPNAELTPDASPRSPSPAARLFQSRPTHRFAPQLIETSRRTRRVGDSGPATRPGDKTDITPYTKNIYTAKPKNRRPHNEDEHPRPMPPTRRESEEEGVGEYLLELAAKEVERQIQEAALAAFPNSHVREGNVAHFYFQESSDDDGSLVHAADSDDDRQGRSRRKSSNLGLTWWHQHMQEHAKQLARERGEHDEAVFDDTISDSELDKMDLSLPPDTLWTTSSRMTPAERRDSGAEAAAEAAAAASRGAAAKLAESQASPSQVNTAAQGQPTSSPFGGFGRPMGAFNIKPDPAAIKKLRKAASPPMLGKDLQFRTCPSPQMTRLEPTHAFDKHQAAMAHRDTNGGGLWGGFCCKDESENGEHSTDCSGRPSMGMLKTPFPPGTPEEEMEDGHHMSEEPHSILDPSEALRAAAASQTLNGDGNGLHTLHGAGSETKISDPSAERDEAISEEFTDAFVTQVYNYLSLGYPATASAFDEELSKISYVSVEELRSVDAKQMVRGHLVEMKIEDKAEDERCPRWRALKRYIYEWAKQHPDLNSAPQAWGVRERRGSWGI